MYYPDYDKLSKEDRELLLSLDIEHLDIKVDEDNDDDVWIDDNCLCFNVIINNIKMSFWWVDAQYYAASLYSKTSIDAAYMMIELIKDREESRLFSLEQ